MQKIKDQIQKIFDSKDVTAQFNTPPNEEMGDFSTAAPFSLAKKMGKNPMEIAEELTSELEGKINNISKITISEPGYLNFFIDYPNFGKTIINNIIDQKTILTNSSKGEKISIEHTGVNPNKAMHIGHLRNSIIGDIITRLYKNNGYTTETLNYIDDTGIQVADIVTALLYLDEPIYGENDNFNDIWDKWDKTIPFDYFCWDLYARFHQMMEHDEKYLELRKKVFTNIEKGTSEIAKFAKEVSTKIIEAHINTCSKLNINFDLLIWESDILAKKLWDETFELLKETGTIVKEEEGANAGCWVVKAGGVEKKDDEQFSKDKILIKSDGSLTYTAKDLAFQIWKLGKLKNNFDYKKWNDTNIITTTSNGESNNEIGHADKIICVIDYRQSYPQEIIKEILLKLGFIKDKNDYYHLSYGVVNLTENAAHEIGIDQTEKSVSMSGRKGIGIKADDLIDLTIKKISEKSKVKDIASELANSAIRFYMTKHTLNQNINFDFEDALRATGESGIYLSYCYARATNILKKAEFTDLKEYEIAEITSAEKNLIKLLSESDKYILNCIDDLDISKICRFTFELCSAFSEFYEQDNAKPIIKLDNENLKNYRLSLVKSFTIVLNDYFKILGINPLEKI
ncbi:MAG: arginine--tRNA ligase [Patescibacteria group bacterium]|jgi:arginyl-tRNA synthetase